VSGEVFSVERGAVNADGNISGIVLVVGIVASVVKVIYSRLDFPAIELPRALPSLAEHIQTLGGVDYGFSTL